MGFPFSLSRMSRFIDCISKIMKLNVFLITGAVLGGASAVVDHDLPVRVFLLVGQSNMSGKGSIKMLTDLVKDDITRPIYQHVIDANDEWVIRDDVKIYYPPITNNGPEPLTVGFGASSDRFGPELEFGRVVGDGYTGPTLLVKAAWGGKDLAVDFRPPSRGISNYTNRDQGVRKSEAPEKVLGPEEYGKYYNMTIDTILDALLQVEAGEVFEGHTEWELSGMVWFQGWNDMCTEDDKKLDEYEENLTHLIRDLRISLGEPDLPVVIGEFGQLGINLKEYGWIGDHARRLRHIQRTVAKCDEFRDLVRVAPTSIFVVDNGETYDGPHHYNGRADTYIRIGQSFGQTMVHMLEDVEHLELEQVA